MSLPSISEFLIKHHQSIKDALQVIDANAQGICFVTDEAGKLVGTLTDGDIRRAFIKGKNLNTLISEVMQKEFVSLPIDTPPEVIQNKLSSKIRHIPLVDESFRPLDYASLSRLHRIPIMEPLLDGNELAYITECIKTGWISSQGNYVKQFEKMFAEFCQMPYALAVSNGTVALHLALETLGIGKGDEVIVPDITFAASINAVIYTGATPVLVDITSDTWTMSLSSLEKAITKKTKAIMPVHLYGHPCQMDEIISLAKKHKLFIIEDCAEAIGSQYKDKPVGSLGDIAIFSFFGNKTITTGEGGMIVFRNNQLYEKANLLRDHGMSKQKKYWHEHIGYNYRMTNLQAAIGVAQMERAEKFIEKKRKLAERYNSILSAYKGIILPSEASWAKNSYWLYTAIIDKKFGISRNELLSKLLKNGVETRPVFYPLHIMPPYKKYIRKNQNFENSIYVSENGISFPSSVTISETEINSIERIIHSIFSTRQMNIACE
jgi:perosamine synthetase